jgi:hypothetical protein
LRSAKIRDGVIGFLMAHRDVHNALPSLYHFTANGKAASADAQTAAGSNVPAVQIVPLSDPGATHQVNGQISAQFRPQF